MLRGPRGGMILSTQEHAAAIDKAVFPMMQGGPLMHAVAAKAVALKEASTPQYQQYARAVIENAQALTAGLEAEGMRAVTGGTDTHLALLDLQPMGVTGAEAEQRCDAAGIVLNKNAIPFDPQPRASPAASGSDSERDHTGYGCCADEGDRRADRSSGARTGCRPGGPRRGGWPGRGVPAYPVG